MSSIEDPNDRPIEFDQGALPGFERGEIEGDEAARARSERLRNDSAALQRNVDVLEQANIRMEPILQMASTMRDMFSEAAEALDKSVSAVGNMTKGTDNLNRAKREGNSYDVMQAEANERAEEAMHRKTDAAKKFYDLQQKGGVQLEAQLRKTALFDEQQGKYNIRGVQGQLEPRQLRDILRDPQHPDYAAVQAAGTRGFSGMPEHPTDPRFRMKEAVGALARGDLGSAAGELVQPFGWTKKLETMGQASRERVEAPGPTKVSDQALSRLLPLAARVIGPAAIIGAQQVISRGLQRYNEAADIGQSAGEGRFAGFREVIGGRAQAAQQALNPFDALTRREAMMIADNIRRSGLTGDVADAWQDVVGDVIIDTGLKGEAAMSAMNTAVFQLGQTAEQFRQSMQNIDDIAKDTNMSVEMAAKGVQSLQLAAAQVGGQAAVSAAGPAADAIMRALSPEGRAPLGIFGEGQPGAGVFVQTPEQRQLLGMQFGGLTATQALGPEFFQNIGKILDGLIDWIHESFPGLSNAAKAQMFMVYGPGAQYLPGMSVRDVELLLDRGGKGKMQSAMAKGRARGIVSDAEAARKAAEAEADPGTGKRFFWEKNPLEIVDDWTKDEGAKDVGEKAYIDTLRKAMKKQGVPENLRREILDPLTQASMFGGDIAQEGGKNVRVEKFEEVRERTEKILLDFAPGTKKYFGNLERAIRTERYEKGLGNSQGTSAVRP